MDLCDRFVLLLIPLLALSLCPPALATDRLYVLNTADGSIDVHIFENFGKATTIRAECTLPRDVETIWRVLSDYENLDTLVPAVIESRIVESETGKQLLYQRGRAGFWILKRGFQVWFQVEEDPMRRITFNAIEGDFRRFEGSWEISERRKGTWISHQVTIEPQFYVPEWAVRMVAVRLMQETVRAVVHRCLKE